ncbi:uncharacterized protein LOC131666299 [Phymastichus coffea]|uniref:uncharacterized protein LOC131666299 n=1 Tax=Phymastichus coffea TaxID=108790 RepID=UPI00273CE21B|nr:uncharacterized protein LOC131666299 [Phymastichus coffea]
MATRTFATDAPAGEAPTRSESFAASALVEKYPRWWLTLSIGQFTCRALYDTGASRTVPLQIAAAMNKRVNMYVGPGAKAVDGHYVPIIGNVQLPFTIGGVTHSIDVLVLSEADAECTLGSDFVRAFSACLDPETNTIRIKGCDQEVPTIVSSLRAEEAMSLAALGIEDISKEQRQEIDRVMDDLLPEPSCEQLSCTGWIEHDIDIGSARPIKQKYYPVSHKIEDEMHAQVHKMLQMGIIRKSRSEWSSPVVMTRKPDGEYRFCVNYRKVNSVTRVSAYPLLFMDAILRKLQHAKFLGMASWYRKFLNDYATICEPFNALTRKDAKFEWQEVLRQVFE